MVYVPMIKQTQWEQLTTIFVTDYVLIDWLNALSILYIMFTPVSWLRKWYMNAHQIMSFTHKNDITFRITNKAIDWRQELLLVE